MTHLWDSEYLNPILTDISGFEECRGFRRFSINTTTKQIMNTKTHRLNRSKQPIYGLTNPEEMSDLEKTGDYFVNVTKNRIEGINYNAQILYSRIENMHNLGLNHL